MATQQHTVRAEQQKAKPQPVRTPVSGNKAGKSVMAQVKLDAKNPIPIELGGQSFASVDGVQFVPFLPPLNTFPSLLMEAAMLSPTQQACISTKTNYCVGEAIVANNIEGGVDADELLKNFLNSCNGKRRTFASVLRRAFGSFFKFGNTPVEIVCGTAGGERYIYVYVKNLRDCRLGNQDENTNECRSMVVSRAFRREGTFDLKKTAHQVIPLYKRGSPDDEKVWLKQSNTQRTALWIRNEMEGYDEYGMPSSVASLIFQILEYNGARYNLDQLENNMVPSGALILSGNLDVTEAQKLGRQIINQHVGPGKRGRISVFSSSAGIADSKFMQFDTKKEGSYDKLDTLCEKKIILSNEWDAVLAGLQTPSSMGKGSGYLTEVYEQKYNTVIRPAQVTMLTEFIAPLMEIADYWLGTNWKAAGLDIKPAKVVNKSSGLINTPEGITAFLSIVEAVASGSYSLDAAIELVADRFSMSIEAATKQLGKINVRKATTPAV